MYSATRRCYIDMQTAGNLVLYRASDLPPFWQTGTHGQNIPKLTFQLDGNLVMYRNDGSVAWASHTEGRGYKVWMQDDGNFVIYDRAGKGIWHTDTHNKGAC